MLQNPPAPMAECDWLYWRQLAYRFARHWRCNSADADDIAQQAILAAIIAGSASRLNHGWFFVVTRRAASDMRARMAREAPAGSFEIAVVQPDERTLLLSEIRQSAVLRSRDHALVARLLEGRSHAEIAAEFGWNTKSVGSRIRRVVDKVQKTVGCGRPSAAASFAGSATANARCCARSPTR